MKKTIGLLLILSVLVLALASCGGKTPAATTAGESAAETAVTDGTTAAATTEAETEVETTFDKWEEIGRAHV